MRSHSHGADNWGSPLSTAKKSRVFSAEGKTVSYAGSFLLQTSGLPFLPDMAHIGRH